MTTSTSAPTSPPAPTHEPAGRPRRRRRVLSAVGLALLVLALAGACTPQQMRAWWDAHGVDHSSMSDEQVKPWADHATAFWAEQADLAKYDHVLTADQLYRLRWCESGGNYGAIGGGGAYRGAYQFHRTTWDAVARQHYPAYVGLDPAAARPQIQDAMARALWSTSGPRPWPVCGARV